MSTITQAVDGLLAGLLLPTTRLLWIHGLFKMVVEGLAPVCRLPADCAADGSRNRIKCAGSKQAGIVLILKSVDKGKYWRRYPVRRSSCDEIADNCRDNSGESVRCTSQEGERAAGRM